MTVLLNLLKSLGRGIAYYLFTKWLPKKVDEVLEPEKEEPKPQPATQSVPKKGKKHYQKRYSSKKK